MGWEKNFLPSIVVFLVALPLSLGIAIASGVPAHIGLISAVIGGIVVGAIAGCPLQVSGPAAGLAVMVFEFVNQFGLAALAPLGITIGLFQLAMGYFKLGKYFKAVSPALIKGMLAGIGFLILLSQIHVGLGVKPLSGGIQNILALPETIIQSFTQNQHSLIVLACSLLLLFSWNKLNIKYIKSIPAPLAGVIFATILAQNLFPQTQFLSIPESMISDLSLFAGFSWDSFSLKMLVMGLAIAVVASAESMLSSIAVEKLQPKVKVDFEKELVAQGAGNFLAGLLGALPITGVIVRSSANIASGATNRMSAILHGAWILLFVLLLPQLLLMIPVAGLAAILIHTGWRLWAPAELPKLFKQSKGDFVTYMGTFTFMVAIDLLAGVLAGFVISLGVLLVRLLETERKTQEEDQTYTYKVKGNISFLHLPKMIEEIPTHESKKIVIDFTDVNYVDPIVRNHFDDWQTESSKVGTRSQILYRNELPKEIHV